MDIYPAPNSFFSGCWQTCKKVDIGPIKGGFVAYNGTLLDEVLTAVTPQ